jgi:hypothetical protein
MLVPGNSKDRASIHIHATYCDTNRRYNDREKGRTTRKRARAIMLAPMEETTRQMETNRSRRVM